MRILRWAAFGVVTMFLLALVVSVVTAAASPIQADYPDFRKPYDTIVRIEILTGEGIEGHGSGFILDDHRIVTAAHVARLGSRFNVILSNGEERAATISAWDREADVAILLIYKSLKRSTRVECKAPPIGTDIRAIGYPLDLGRTVTRGYTATEAGPKATRTSAIMADIGIAKGMSGGPVYDQFDRVIGIGIAFVPAQYGTSLSMLAAGSEICRLARIGPYR